MTEQLSIFDMGIEEPSRWEIDIDNDLQMLRCKSCGARAIRIWYDRAVGGYGFKHCPYCGKSMGNWQKMIVPWPGFNEKRPKKWIPLKRGEHGYSVSDFRCGYCGEPCPCYYLTNYCPNCGENMRGVNK